MENNVQEIVWVIEEKVHSTKVRNNMVLTLFVTHNVCVTTLEQQILLVKSFST